jgi:hypothetical protein
MTHGSGTPPTTRDLYRELRAVTPDSLRYLLHDLFEANTFWDLEAESVRAEPTDAGWRVTLDVRARKVRVDEAGVETEVPMDDWVEVGVFGPAEPGGDERSRPLHIHKHRVRSGAQRITVTVRGRPVLAVIDPRHLLTDRDMDDNLVQVMTSE